MEQRPAQSGAVGLGDHGLDGRLRAHSTTLGNVCAAAQSAKGQIITTMTIERNHLKKKKVYI